MFDFIELRSLSWVTPRPLAPFAHHNCKARANGCMSRHGRKRSDMVKGRRLNTIGVAD